MGANIPAFNQIVPRTPLSTDLFVRQVFNIHKSPNITVPAFGASYDSVTGAVKQAYPNHKFCWQTEPDQEGNVIRWFLADLPSQQLYNWVYSDEGDWPAITQTFVIARASYNANPADPATTYPPPPNTNFNLTGFAITGTQEVRIGDERLDSLYVAVQVTREKINTPQSSVKFDPDTGTLRTFTRQKVPAGTAGSVIDNSGKFSEVNATNSLWSDKLVEYAPGLAGSAVDGESSRTWQFSLDYYFPPVLNYVLIQPVYADPGDVFSEVIGYITAPIWLVDQYNGPCDATMLETWYKDPPPFIQPDVLLPVEIEFRGPGGFQVFVPRSLHQGFTFFDSGFSQYYEPTDPEYWPASMVVSVDVAPQYGGWLQRIITINSPSVRGRAPGIVLTQTAQDFDSFTLSWTAETPSPTHTTTVNIATSPQFDSGFLPGYQGLVVAAGTTTLEVTGAQPGRYYYAQVTRNGITSNIVICGVQPSAIIQVSQNGIVLSSGQDVNAGSIAPGEENPLTFLVSNRGSLLMNNLAVSISGVNASQYQLGSISSTSISPGGSASFQVVFAPTTGGSKQATVSIAHDGAGANPFLVDLVGTAVAPVMQVEQPLNTILSNGTTSNFGTYTTTPISRTFYVRNTGTLTLSSLAAAITGTDETDFTITTMPDSTVAISGLTSLTVEFNPIASDTSDDREAVLTLTSNDPVNSPFVINLTGLYQSPTAPGVVDPTFLVDTDGPVYAIAMLADGSSVIGGDFTTVNGDPIANCAKVSDAGVVDLTFTPTPNGPVYALAVQEDGNILLGGNFNTIDGNSQAFLARISSTGTWDSGYTPSLDSFPLCLAIQADGKAVAGGEFSTPEPYIARFGTTGTADGTFTTEVNGRVNGIVILNDGKLVIVGDFVGTGPPPPTTTTTVAPTTTTTPPPTTTSPPPTTTTTVTSTTTTPPPPPTTTTTPTPTTTTTPPPPPTTTTTPAPTTTTTPSPTTTTPPP